MSWEAHIKQQIETLTIEQIQHYFRKKYRGRFYVDMKRLVAVGLREQDFTLEKIAEIIYHNKKRHCSVLDGLRKTNEKSINKKVEKQFIDWIKNNKYPVSKNKTRAPKTEYEKAICEKFRVNQIHYLDFKLRKSWRFVKN